MRGISGLFQNYNVGMLLLEGPRRRLKGSKETSTKLCVMKRLLSIAEATAHEITPGDYAKKRKFCNVKEAGHRARALHPLGSGLHIATPLSVAKRVGRMDLLGGGLCSPLAAPRRRWQIWAEY